MTVDPLSSIMIWHERRLRLAQAVSSRRYVVFVVLWLFYGVFPVRICFEDGTCGTLINITFQLKDGEVA